MDLVRSNENDQAIDSSLGERLLSWFSINDRGYPWRKTRDPFAILVAEVLLLQTNAGKVPRVWEHIIREYPTPHALADADVEILTNVIKPLGFSYRARVLTAISKQLCEQFNATVPSSIDDLRLIKWVGDYTASAIACFAYGQPVPVVDTNVVRVMSRVHGISGKKIFEQVKTYAEISLRGHPPREYNWAVLDFGAMICKTNKPRCSVCMLSDLCRKHLSGSDSAD